MAADDFNPADLDELLVALREVLPADTDPTKVRAPGVWVRFDRLEFEHLAGLTIATTLHVVVSDNERELTALAGKFNQVKNHLRTKGLHVGGPVTPTGLILPGSATALPCLATPLTIPTCQHPEE